MSIVSLDQPEDPSLNPAQAEAATLLREPREQRPVHRVALRAELRAFLDEELQDVAAWLPETLFISKHTLASVHGCEERFLHELSQPFAANAATVRGAVAHKAIEYSVGAATASPGRLVDRALLRMSEGQDWVAEWLQGADEFDQAEVRTAAADRVAKFIECFPPLRRGWRPVAESRWSQDLHAGRIALRGKVDLTIGGPDGMRAGKVVIDLKSGGSPSNIHAEDLRFYALLETLRIGTPPWKIASYYLDSGTFALELVNEDLLFQAARRLIDGTIKVAELRHGERIPQRAAGPACRWCALYPECPDGKRARLADGDEP